MGANWSPPLPDRRTLLTAIGCIIALTALASGWELRTIPDYRPGEIADRTIRALHDFAVEDPGSTELHREQAAQNAPVVFDFDPRVADRLTEELHGQLAATAVAPQTESVLAGLLRAGLSYPGIVADRELLLRYEQRGILVRNVVTRQRERLPSPASVTDLPSARERLLERMRLLDSVSDQSRLSYADLLTRGLAPNLALNETESRQVESEARDGVDRSLVQVTKGRLIVRAGERVSQRDADILQAVRQRTRPARLALRYAGVAVVVLFLFLMVFWSGLAARRRLGHLVDYPLLACTVWIVAVAIIRLATLLGDMVAAAAQDSPLRDPIVLYYAAPFSLSAILLVLLADRHLATVGILATSVMAGLIAADIRIFGCSLLSGLAAILALRDYRERAAVARGAWIIAAATGVSAAALQLSVLHVEFSAATTLSAAGFAAAGAILAAMMASLLLPILEALFGVTTDIRLLELSNLNAPLLRRLAVEAPGTYHHSLMVAALAEAGAEAIGANPLLARVGALYHDIGKLTGPESYLENQPYAGDERASRPAGPSSLQDHVKEGLAIADDVRLAPEVRAMIPQHHGTRLRTFFYKKALEAVGGDKTAVDRERFRYQGPKPQSKEAAILMLADQVEAASRTWGRPEPGHLPDLLRRVVRTTLEDGQLDECAIAVRDLDATKRAFERVLMGRYHQRIEYPRFEFSDAGTAKRAGPRIQ